MFVLIVLISFSFSCGIVSLPYALTALYCLPVALLFIFPEMIAFVGAILPLLTQRTEFAWSLCNYGLKLAPQNPLLHLLAGIISFRQKNYEDAERSMTAVLDKQTSSPVNFLNRAAVRCCLSKFEEAEDDANEAIKLAPKELKAYHNRAVARLGQQNYEGCLADCYYLQKNANDSDSVRLMIVESLLLLGKLAEADAFTAAMIGKAKNGSGDALSVAQLHYCRNQFVDVLALCAEVNDREPLAIYFVNLQGFAYWSLSEGALSMHAAARSIAFDQRAPNGYLLRAYVLADAGQLDAALEACQSPTVKLSPLSIARDGEAYVHWHRGEWQSMFDATTAAIAKCHTSSSSFALHSLALAGLGRTEEALKAALSATKIQPLDVRGWHALAHIYLDNGHIFESLNAINAGLAANPHDRHSYRLRAEIHLQMGNRRLADVDYKVYDELLAKLKTNL